MPSISAYAVNCIMFFYILKQNSLPSGVILF